MKNQKTKIEKIDIISYVLIILIIMSAIEMIEFKLIKFVDDVKSFGSNVYIDKNNRILEKCEVNIDNQQCEIEIDRTDEIRKKQDSWRKNISSTMCLLHIYAPAFYVWFIISKISKETYTTEKESNN